MLIYNVVNTTGEYILGRTVVSLYTASHGAAAIGGLDEKKVIGEFYGNYFTVVNIISALLQGFVVSRVLKRFGVRVALLVLPVVAMLGYVAMAFVPLMGFIRGAKVAENSLDYSLQNTARNALYLPTSREAKYKAKQANDTFFVRFGDVISAGRGVRGHHLAGFRAAQFALVNVVLIAVWLVLRSRSAGTSTAWRTATSERGRLGQLLRTPPELAVAPGEILGGPGRGLGRGHFQDEGPEHEIREREQDVQVPVHVDVMDAVVLFQELEPARALHEVDLGLVHEIVHALVACVVRQGRDAEADEERQIGQLDAHRREPPGQERPRDDVEGDEKRPSPPLEVKRLLLLLLDDVERILEFAELVVDQRVRREAVLGEPRAVQPVTVERPTRRSWTGRWLQDSRREWQSG